MEIMADEKREQVLDAGMDRFLRYGFRKTTMGDIAEAAEMSRPAVYLVYQNKEEIFRGVIERHSDRTLALGRDRIAACKSLRKKITAVFETWVIEPYQLISKSPEARELFVSSYSFAADLMQRGVDMYESLMMEAIESTPEVDPAALKRVGLSKRAVGKALARSSWKLDRATPDLDELRSVLKTLVRVYEVILTGGGAEAT